jgi:hypothetical protein
MDKLATNKGNQHTCDNHKFRLSPQTLLKAGNQAINIHREGSVELLMLALDYYEHTLDTTEFEQSILPISVAVTDFVSSYYGRTANGQLDIWPTQSLEGCVQHLFLDNTTSGRVGQHPLSTPICASLHTVLPPCTRCCRTELTIGSKKLEALWCLATAACDNIRVVWHTIRQRKGTHPRPSS